MGQQSTVCCGLQLLLNVWAGGWRDGMNGTDREMRWRDQGRYMRRRPGRGDRCLRGGARGKGIDGPRWPRREVIPWVGRRRGSRSACDQSLSDDGKDFLPQIILKFNTGAEGEDGCVSVCGNARLTTCYLVWVWFIAWRKWNLGAFWWGRLCWFTIRSAVNPDCSRETEIKGRREAKSYRLGPKE